MPTLIEERREQSHLRLRQLYNTFRATLNPHLDVSARAGMAVDASTVNLYEETARGALLPSNVIESFANF